MAKHQEEASHNRAVGLLEGGKSQKEVAETLGSPSGQYRGGGPKPRLVGARKARRVEEGRRNLAKEPKSQSPRI